MTVSLHITGRLILTSFLLGLTLVAASSGRELTLDDALDRAVNLTSRAEIIRGSLEVAERKYFAERVNFYLPEISLNGNLPSYQGDDSFRHWWGLRGKQMVKTTNLDFMGDIELTQSLLTGGKLTVRGNLLNSDYKRPDDSILSLTVLENTQQGLFDFELQQPILKPSEARHELGNTKDDLEIARLNRITEIAELKTEVVEAYFGVLQLSLKTELTTDKHESARLKADIDSAKFHDGVVSEETWLESESARLDVELEQFDIANQQKEKKRELVILLDFNENETVQPAEPPLPVHLTDQDKELIIENWENSTDVLKAWYDFRKEQRTADYAASGHGLTGDLKARYSLGRGEVNIEGAANDNIRTNSWEVSLNFNYPIWDGGASGAAVQAARLEEEKSRIEYERTKRSARAEIVNLINRLDVGYRKLKLLEQQIQLVHNKLDIAQFRLNDGQISMITYLESKIAYLEVRDKYLEELKNYLLDKITLESKYTG